MPTTGALVCDGARVLFTVIAITYILDEAVASVTRSVPHKLEPCTDKPCNYVRMLGLPAPENVSLKFPLDPDAANSGDVRTRIPGTGPHVIRVQNGVERPLFLELFHCTFSSLAPTSTEYDNNTDCIGVCLSREDDQTWIECPFTTSTTSTSPQTTDRPKDQRDSTKCASTYNFSTAINRSRFMSHRRDPTAANQSLSSATGSIPGNVHPATRMALAVCVLCRDCLLFPIYVLAGFIPDFMLVSSDSGSDPFQRIPSGYVEGFGSRSSDWWTTVNGTAQDVCNRAEVMNVTDNFLDRGFPAQGTCRINFRLALFGWALCTIVHDLILCWYKQQPEREGRAIIMTQEKLKAGAQAENFTLLAASLSVIFLTMATAACFSWSSGAMSIFVAELQVQHAKSFGIQTTAEMVVCFYKLPRLQALLALGVPILLLSMLQSRVRAVGQAMVQGDFLYTDTFSLPFNFVTRGYLWGGDFTLYSSPDSGDFDQRWAYWESRRLGLLLLESFLDLIQVLQISIVGFDIMVKACEIATDMIHENAGNTLSYVIIPLVYLPSLTLFAMAALQVVVLLLSLTRAESRWRLMWDLARLVLPVICLSAGICLWPGELIAHSQATVNLFQAELWGNAGVVLFSVGVPMVKANLFTTSDWLQELKDQTRSFVKCRKCEGMLNLDKCSRPGCYKEGMHYSCQTESCGGHYCDEHPEAKCMIKACNGVIGGKDEPGKKCIVCQQPGTQFACNTKSKDQQEPCDFAICKKDFEALMETGMPADAEGEKFRHRVECSKCAGIIKSLKCATCSKAGTHYHCQTQSCGRSFCQEHPKVKCNIKGCTGHLIEITNDPEKTCVVCNRPATYSAVKFACDRQGCEFCVCKKDFEAFRNVGGVSPTWETLCQHIFEFKVPSGQAAGAAVRIDSSEEARALLAHYGEEEVRADWGLKGQSIHLPKKADGLSFQTLKNLPSLSMLNFGLHIMATRRMLISGSWLGNLAACLLAIKLAANCAFLIFKRRFAPLVIQKTAMKYPWADRLLCTMALTNVQSYAELFTLGIEDIPSEAEVHKAIVEWNLLGSRLQAVEDLAIMIPQIIYLAQEQDEVIMLSVGIAALLILAQVFQFALLSAVSWVLATAPLETIREEAVRHGRKFPEEVPLWELIFACMHVVLFLVNIDFLAHSGSITEAGISGQMFGIVVMVTSSMLGIVLAFALLRDTKDKVWHVVALPANRNEALVAVLLLSAIDPNLLKLISPGIFQDRWEWALKLGVPPVFRCATMGALAVWGVWKKIFPIREKLCIACAVANCFLAVHLYVSLDLSYDRDEDSTGEQPEPDTSTVEAIEKLALGLDTAGAPSAA